MKKHRTVRSAGGFLSALLCLCMLLSLSAFASGGPSGEAPKAGAFAQVDETHWAGSSLTVKAVEIAPAYAEYVDATQFCNISKIVYDGGEIDVDSGKYAAVLTVGGIQEDLYNAAGSTFEGDVVITLVEKAASTNQGNSKFGDDAGSLIGPFSYIAAAYFDEEGYHPNNSVEAAQGGGEITDNSVEFLEFVSDGDYMSGVYVGGGEVTIKNSAFGAFGRGGDDFSGQGAAVISAGNAKVNVDNCFFGTQGALRSAIWAGGSSEMNVSNSIIQSFNDEELVPYSTEDNYATPMMQQVPFALGLTGNIRATLDCGQADISFTDCIVASTGWAVLSTDSGSGTLVATDTVALLGELWELDAEGEHIDEVIEMNGMPIGVQYGRVGEMSGYIAYCDGFTDYAYGGRWFAPDYLAIITGGKFNIAASDKGRFYGWSDRIGFMSHQTGASAELNISEADFDVTDTFIMVKSKGGNGETIRLDDVTLNLTGTNPWGGAILQLMDSDDLGGGPGATTFTVPYGSYDEYLAADGNGAGGVTTLNITDCSLSGDIYNSVGSQTGSQKAFKEDGIVVNMVDSSLTGAVSSAYAAHCTDEGRILTGTITVDSYGREGTYDYLAIGRLMNFPAPTVHNPVSLNLQHSTWNVSGVSYLSSLTIDNVSSITGDVYQNGRKLDLTAGTYENVVVVPRGMDLASVTSGTMEVISAAAADGVVPADRSELVKNVDMGGSGEASGGAS